MGATRKNAFRRVETTDDVSREALDLCRESLFWDGILPYDHVFNGPFTDELFPRLRRVGYDFVSASVEQPEGFDATATAIGWVKRQVAARSETMAIVGSLSEIMAARDAGKVAVGFNLQNTVPFGQSIDKIGLLRDLGVRQIGLAYNTRNFVGDGCVEPDNAGLSRFGKEAVREMGRLGIVVDGSHAGSRTTLEAMDALQGPFVFSHSNPNGVHKHYRNISDEQIRMCAATGGLVGINGAGWFLGDLKASTETIFRCVDYVAQLVGVNHVGIGLDYVHDTDSLFEWVSNSPLAWPQNEPGSAHEPSNFATPEQIPQLIDLMLANGYSPEDAKAVLGGNWARVASEVWART